MPRCRAPGRSYAMTSPTPWRSSSFMIAVPAAPAPETTTRTSASCLPTTRSALVSAASTQIAVPCWSSWKTGMSSSSRSRASISKQRGAAMSSRLMPPYAGAIALHDRDDLVGVLGVEHDRPGVDAAEALEQRRLALHHRQRGGRADVAQAEHGRAVGDHRDGVALDGQPAGVGRVLRDRQADPGHPRRVRPGQLVAVAQRDLRGDLDLAAEVQQERAVGDLADVDPVQRLQRLDHLVGVGGVGGVAGEVDDDAVVVGVDHVEGGDDRAGLADAVVSRPIADASAVTAIRIGDRESGAGQAGGRHGVPPSFVRVASTALLARAECWVHSRGLTQLGRIATTPGLDYVDARAGRACHDRSRGGTFCVLPTLVETTDATTGELELEERHALRRVAGLSTELADVTEVEYRQLRLERVVLVGVWTEGTVDRRGELADRARRARRDRRLAGARGPDPAAQPARPGHLHRPRQGRRAASRGRRRPAPTR